MRTPAVEDQHIYRVFSVKKSHGKDCLTLFIYLSPLNLEIPKIHFRMEDHEYLENLTRPDDFMVSVDLSNDLFLIVLHKDGKKFCLFEFKSNKYNFYDLPFGLTLTP